MSKVPVTRTGLLLVDIIIRQLPHDTEWLQLYMVPKSCLREKKSS